MVQPGESATAFVRRPYTGSCTCGTVKYIAWLALPDTSVDNHEFREGSGLNVYKCNCTTCHKMGIFHLRLASAADDFVVLSPLDIGDKESRVSTFRAHAKEIDWWFCTVCGVHPFAIDHGLEGAEVDVPINSLKRLGLSVEADTVGEHETIKTKVLRLKEGFADGPNGEKYLSLNAITLDAGQEGLDLRQWSENGWVDYHDSLDGDADSASKPFRGGMY